MHSSNAPALVAQKDHWETISSIFMVVVNSSSSHMQQSSTGYRIQSENYAYFSSSSFKSPLTFSVTLKPPNSQSLPRRPQCEVEAGEGLCFLGSCGLEVGLDAIGETAGSEVVRFACGVTWVKVVLIRAVLVVLLGGEGRGSGEVSGRLCFVVSLWLPSFRAISVKRLSIWSSSCLITSSSTVIGSRLRPGLRC